MGLTMGRALAIALLGATAAWPEAPAADLVVLNGKVLTVDPDFRRAEALAIRDGVFVLVGTNEQARALVGKATGVIDAAGRTVVPGLIDSHGHALMVGGSEARGAFPDLGAI